MLIKLKRPRGRTINAILVIAAIGEDKDLDGLIRCEFYPVDRVLALRHSDRILKGHPLLDLEPQAGEDSPTVIIERLEPGKASNIQRQCGKHSKLLAITNTAPRPPKLGGNKRWQRMQQARQDEGLATISDRTGGRVNFYFLDRGSVTELSAGDLAWLDSVCQSGYIYVEQLQAAQGIGLFVQWFVKAGLEAGIEARKREKKRRRGKRKERQQREAYSYD